MKCGMDKCEAEATHAVKVCVPATGWPINMHQPATLTVPFKCCRDHVRRFDIQEFFRLNPKLAEVFRILLKGKCPPDFERAFVEPIPLDDPDLLKLESMKAK